MSTQHPDNVAQPFFAEGPQLGGDVEVEEVGRLSRAVYETNPFVPARRRRKLHVGLFGYARTMHGVALPRAIGFTASLYSVGLPPEVLGLDALTEQDLEFVRGAYLNFDADLRDAVRYLNPDTGTGARPASPEARRTWSQAGGGRRVPLDHGAHCRVGARP